jgi:N-acetylglucosamine-6-sulfatase
MQRREFLLGALTPALAQPAAAERPNIVFMLVDDLRWDVLSVLGHPFMKTPHLDRLRNEGVLFSNAFVTTSLCSPSRGSFLTGAYAHRHGVTDNTGKEFDSAKTPSYPQLLQRAGYETAYIGKWHMARHAEPRPGFDYWLSFRGQGVYIDPPLNENGREFKANGYMTDILTDKAVEWLGRKHDKPFCLYIGHKAVHGPFTPADRHKDLYSGVVPPEPPNYGDDLSTKPAWQRRLRRPKSEEAIPASITPPPWPPKNPGWMDYFRTISAVDESVGRIYDELKRKSLLDKTIFVFTSDNGFFKGEHGGLGDKRLAYEEALRVPLLVRYPGAAKPKSTIPEMVLSIDVAPTLLDFAGVKPGSSMQGRSFRPLLDGKKAAWRESFLYEYWVDLNQIPRMVAVRTRTHKYIRYPDIQDIDEMYDLVKDPHEMRNVALDPAYAAKKKELAAELDRLLRDTGYPQS